MRVMDAVRAIGVGGVLTLILFKLVPELGHLHWVLQSVLIGVIAALVTAIWHYLGRYRWW